MAQVDVFIILDVVQYEKNYFQNRNRIRAASTESGWTWLTVPVLTKGRSNQLIMDVEVNNVDLRWGDKNWRTIEHNYRNAPFFSQYSGFIRDAYTTSTWKTLIELNLHLIRQINEELGISTPLVQASELQVCGASSELLLSICKEMGATTYMSGPSGKDYLNESLFHEANISIVYQEFHHPEYQQAYQPFIPQMSVIDLLFNYGSSSLDVILGRPTNTGART